MTAFNTDTAKKVANLARLSLTDDEITKYAGQMGNILKFVEQLATVNTDNVAPLANVVDISLHLRDDVVTDGNVQTGVLANAPETVEGYFVVQKIVE